MSRRARAVAFAGLALVCAALAAAAAGGYRGGVEAELGELRPVLIARAELPVRRPLGMHEAQELLEVRRVPERFAPADALASPVEAVGQAPVAPVPAGAYLTSGLLRLPGDEKDPVPTTAPPESEAVEVTVTGAEALTAQGGDQAGAKVDVVVTTEPRTGGEGRTYVAAESVRLLALREAGPPDDAGGLGASGPASWIATLAASREQALRLIHAHNYARELRLIAAP